MGTRGLTIVRVDNKIKVAQYGQWDHTPRHQGKTILEFLHLVDLKAFADRVRELKFFTPNEIDKLGEGWLDDRPWLSRDLGGKILTAIMDGVYKKKTWTYTPGSLVGTEKEIVYRFTVDKLINEYSFRNAFDCEGIFVVDLDKNVFQVYNGTMKKSNLIGSYDLNKLPSVESFVNELEPESV